MKKSKLLILSVMVATQVVECANWIRAFKNDSAWNVETQSSIQNSGYLYGDGVFTKNVPGGGAVYALLPGSTATAKNFILPWESVKETLYVTVQTDRGPQYYTITEEYQGNVFSPQRFAKIVGPGVMERKKIADDMDLSIYITKEGTPEVRNKNFEVLP